MKRPTQQDVARIAGVSRATVSHVLNGRVDGNVPISEETRQRVMQAIAETGYVPDARAQSLRSGDTRTLGILIPELGNPHPWDYAIGAREEAESAGYHLLIAQGDLSGSERDTAASILSRWSLDGLIVNGMFTTQMEESSPLTRLIKHMPIVDIGYGEGEGVDRIVADYYEATRKTIQYLFNLNHRRIGLSYGVPREDMGYDRLCAYQDGLEAVGISVDESLIEHCGSTMEDAYRAATALFARPDRPTALIAVNDMLAVAAIRAAADLKLRVPEDVSVVGYDDIPISSYIVPRLTTISKDAKAMGQMAVQLLLKRLENPGRRFERIAVEPHLVVRESTAPAPALHP